MASAVHPVESTWIHILLFAATATAGLFGLALGFVAWTVGLWWLLGVAVAFLAGAVLDAVAWRLVRQGQRERAAAFAFAAAVVPPVQLLPLAAALLLRFAAAPGRPAAVAQAR